MRRYLREDEFFIAKNTLYTQQCIEKLCDLKGVHRSAHLICDIVQAEKKGYFSQNIFFKYLTGGQSGIFVPYLLNI